MKRKRETAMATDLFSNENLTTIEIEPEDETQELVMNIFINEGRRREREEVVELLMTKYNELCCCDSASFGSHYLANCQPDNLIKLISERKIG